MSIQWCQACGLLPGHFRGANHLHGDAVLCDSCVQFYSSADVLDSREEDEPGDRPTSPAVALMGLVALSVVGWVVVLAVAYLVTR